MKKEEGKEKEGKGNEEKRKRKQRKKSNTLLTERWSYCYSCIFGFANPPVFFPAVVLKDLLFVSLCLSVTCTSYNLSLQIASFSLFVFFSDLYYIQSLPIYSKDIKFIHFWHCNKIRHKNRHNFLLELHENIWVLNLSLL